MKVLIYEHSSDFGGVNKVISLLKSKISESPDVSVDVCYLYEGDIPCDDVISGCTFLHPFANYDRRSLRLLKFFTTDIFLAYRYIKNSKPDIIVSFGALTYLHIIFIRLILTYKIIVSERNDPYSHNSMSIKLIRYFYKYADKVVFQTKAAQSFFNEKIQRKSIVIPNPVVIPDAKWVANNNKVILTVGRIDIKQKRQDVLIEAYKIVSISHPEYSLRIVGSGADDDLYRLRSLAKELDIESCVDFAGYKNNIRREMLDADIFVLSSDFEGQPNALLEAMALGLPVISTDYSPGGVNEIIVEGTGLFVPRRDSQKLANAIIHLIENHELKLAYGKAARKYMSNFSSEIIANKWLIFFNSL